MTMIDNKNIVLSLISKVENAVCENYICQTDMEAYTTTSHSSISKTNKIHT